MNRRIFIVWLKSSLLGFDVRIEVELPIVYQGRQLPKAYRLDLLVDQSVIVEVKAVEALHPVHEAQLLTYLKLSDLRLGYLLNFNVELMKQGIKRRVL